MALSAISSSVPTITFCSFVVPFDITAQGVVDGFPILISFFDINFIFEFPLRILLFRLQ
ncbi:hypothetical protein MASR2M54_03700 [Aliarcobacter cryaerophilus]